MEMLDFNTRLFKNIFPDYDTFAAWYRGTPLSEDINDVPSEKTFTILAYEFNDSHISLSPDSFKQHFANDLYTYYKEFEATTKSISELMQLTDSDIATADTLVTNFADVPETKKTTDVTSVDYISNQQKNINIKGTLQIKREQLSNKRTFTVKTFLKRFRHLFIKICSPAYTFVVREEDEE